MKDINTMRVISKAWVNKISPQMKHVTTKS